MCIRDRNVVGAVNARIRTAGEDLVLLTYFPLAGGATTFYHRLLHRFAFLWSWKTSWGGASSRPWLQRVSLFLRQKFRCGERGKKACTFLSPLLLINILMLIIPTGLDTVNSEAEMCHRTEFNDASEIVEARIPRWMADTLAHADRGSRGPQSGY